jgi:hypothetical protein
MPNLGTHPCDPCRSNDDPEGALITSLSQQYLHDETAAEELVLIAKRLFTRKAQYQKNALL